MLLDWLPIVSYPNFLSRLLELLILEAKSEEPYGFFTLLILGPTLELESSKFLLECSRGFSETAIGGSTDLMLSSMIGGAGSDFFSLAGEENF